MFRCGGSMLLGLWVSPKIGAGRAVPAGSCEVQQGGQSPPSVAALDLS